MNKDLQHILERTHKWHDGSWPCIQHFDHMSLNNMDLDTFLVYMQGGSGIPDQSCTPALVLKESKKESHAYDADATNFMRIDTSNIMEG